MAYTTQANIEAFIKRSLDANEVILLTVLLAVVDKFIDDQVISGWNSNGSETRYYNGGSKILNIDPCRTVTVVKSVDEEEVQYYEYDLNEEYEARPRNDTVKTYIESRVGKFPDGVSNMAVTATFNRGASAPSDIIYLATYLAAQLLSDNIKNNIKSESIEGYSRTFLINAAFSDETTKKILNPYIKNDTLI